MAVIIPDLEMPKNCVSCPFCICYKASLTYCNLLEADLNTTKAKVERAKGCTLKEIDLKTLRGGVVNARRGGKEAYRADG